MPLVKVRFYSLWKKFLEIDQTTIETNDVNDALVQLDENYGAKLRDQMLKHGITIKGSIQNYSLILINGISIKSYKCAELKEGDILQVFPYTAGG